jgi:hypothetical protein
MPWQKLFLLSDTSKLAVAEGMTFGKVQVPYKVAVDPQFQFNFRDHADEHTIFHEVTSDVFYLP